MTTATEESVNKLLRDTINLILGRSNTIRSSQKNAPRPKTGNYADVNIISDRNLINLFLKYFYAPFKLKSTKFK